MYVCVYYRKDDPVGKWRGSATPRTWSSRFRMMMMMEMTPQGQSLQQLQSSRSVLYGLVLGCCIYAVDHGLSWKTADVTCCLLCTMDVPPLTLSPLWCRRYRIPKAPWWRRSWGCAWERKRWASLPKSSHKPLLSTGSGRLHLTSVLNPAPDPVIVEMSSEWADIVFSWQ